MANKFSYRARDKNGEISEGIIEVPDKEAAAKALADRGLVPLTISPAKSDIAKISVGAFFAKFRGIPSLEKVIFSRQFSTMINAGLPMSQSLHILERQTTNDKFKHVIESLDKDVQAGLSLSSSLAKHPKVFSPLYVSMVRAGEVGGILDEVLERLATQLEKEHDLNAKIRGAMVYPSVILLAMVGVATLMLILVIPQLAELFKESNVALPLPTQILVAVSGALVGYWFIILPVLAGLLLLFIRFIRSKRGRRIFDRVILKVPVFGGLTKKIALARFNRMLGSLMASGIAVIDSLEVTADSIGNTRYTDEVKNLIKRVKVGVTMATPLRNSALFPPLVSQMIAVGEETGTLDKILDRLAVFYENEVDRIVNNLTTILEPLIILVMGVGVAFLVISLILPVLQLSTTF